MASERHRFNNLDSMIDQVHALFDEWDERESGADTEYSADRLYRAKLAVHEWLANLVQHARFPDMPEILLELNHSDTVLECVIEDNSEGFDFADQLRSRQQIEDAFPSRGMGLLLLNACAHDLSYVRKDDGRHRLRFSISDGYCRPLNFPF